MIGPIARTNLRPVVPELAGIQSPDAEDGAPAPGAVESEPGRTPAADPRRVGANETARELTPEDQREVERLAARDREVRAHEQAHAAAGGSQAGAPSYTYETGPDGRRYAVGGEVSIDTKVDAASPAQSVAKLQRVVRAALAPAAPSGQDRKVASQAQAKIARLRAEMIQEQPEAVEGEPGRAKAAQAYAGAPDSNPVASTLDVVACQDCGSGHAP